MMENKRINSDHYLSHAELDKHVPAGNVKHTWTQRQRNDLSWDIVLHWVPAPVTTETAPAVVDE